MRPEYDLLVIGGGPGGALAASTAAEAGLSVGLVEKRPAIGVPIRCAEGVGRDLLEEFMDPDPAWISAEIDRAVIVAPDGYRMSLEPSMAGSEVGYVIDRKRFDRELVMRAGEAGADIQVKTRAILPIMENGTVCGARIEQNGHVQDVRARVVVAADGIESKFSRWCGVDTTVPLAEIETCVQYLMTGIDIDEAATVFHLGNEIAPEGYVWVFPKGPRTANVGIGISGRKSRDGHRPIDYLNRFVRSNFPDGRVVEWIMGGVSVCPPLEKTVADGLMIVGDAARVSDPITGGGIYNAMFTGRLAAQVAADAIAKGDVSAGALMPYDSGWRTSKLGSALRRNYRIKEYFIRLTDEKLNRLVHSISRLDLAKFSTLEIIKELIRHDPGLLLELKAIRELL
ncbi:MAG TPA: NAD(P)/FAD-dependent oxidoreductase [Methanoregulaceae archaeon]|nr:NAD(P)/FAD-dependent oxidoreductase [Methanoregulaceae archaeon]HOV68074.1 NAD(P)/FAD-dependent oxidoreductase [Methanoregulaceae archaeon]HQJ88506.1 NAD(P)/FAD-dependent oxidoreductase [Methanoregulaceae archaeon]